MRLLSRHLTRACLIAAAALAVLSAPAAAKEEPRALDVRPTAVPPVIDGVLDDAAWRDAAHSDAFRQVYPGEGTDPSERTEFWVTYDADHLYVAVRCHDSAGLAGIRAYSMQHDQDNGSDDLVRIVFDSFHRQSDGYYFGLTAAGAEHDGLVQNKEEPNNQWDGLWTGKVTRDAGGWSAEFAIPTKSIAFDPAGHPWGFNVARVIRRKQEFERWSGFVRAKSEFALADAGELRGFTGLRQGRGLEFRPFASVTARAHPEPGEQALEFKPGLDFVWQVTPSLAATATINTDFADAEVDQRQINLGRFPLFFPEKRSFFTQDASLFTFGGIQQDPLPFFSRRIGLADDGSKVDILGGAKLTGRAGPWTIGVLDVQTGEHLGVPSQNLFAGRLSRQVLDESSVGLVATRGDPSGAGNNSLVGADFDYANSHLPGGKAVTVRTGVQVTDSDRAGGTGSAATVSVNYPNEPFGFNWWFSRVDDKYDPALGFVSRTGIGDIHLLHTYNIYSKSKLLRLTQFFIETDNVTDLHLNLLDDGRWTGFYLENPTGDWANVWLGHSRETYLQPFEIQPGIIIPAGRHIYDYFQAQFGTTRSRPVDLNVRWRHGGFITGRTDDLYVNLGARPSSRVELALSAGLRDIRLPEGNFSVRTASGRIVYTFSPDLQVSLLGQYDNISDSLGVNFRIKWTVQPGNEVFLVCNEGYDTSLDRFRPVQSDVSLKGVWTYRF
jgi:hypothetical protein